MILCKIIELSVKLGELSLSLSQTGIYEPHTQNFLRAARQKKFNYYIKLGVQTG